MENRIPEYKMVEVEWFDAQSAFGQAEFIDEAVKNMKPIHTFSIGYLLNEDKKSVLLGFMLFGDQMVKHNQLIPRGMIVKIRELSRVKK